MALHLLLIISSALFLFAIWAAGTYGFGKDRDRSSDPEPWLVYLSFGLMLLVRICLAPAVRGYTLDVGTFQAWAMQAARDLPRFYSGDGFSDYPPGYMYVLFLIGKLKAALLMTDDSRAFLGLIKLPAIIADMATVVLVYVAAEERKGKRCAFALALIYGFNPAIIINSAVWGQVDAVFTILMALSVYCLTKEWLVRAVVAYAFALLVKPQALIFTPLLLFALFDRLMVEWSAWTVKKVLWSAAAGLGVFVAGILPFALKEGPFWIFRHYRATLDSYPYATLNAFNLFALSGGNFAADSSTWLVLSYRSWGMIFILAIVAFACAVYFNGRREGRFFYLAMFLIAAVFLLGCRMHERYLFPVLIFSLLTSLYNDDGRVLALFAGFSVTHFLNVAEVLIASMHGVYQIPRFDPLLIVTSVTNLLLFAVTVGYAFIPISFRAKQPG